MNNLLRVIEFGSSSRLVLAISVEADSPKGHIKKMSLIESSNISRCFCFICLSASISAISICVVIRTFFLNILQQNLALITSLFSNVGIKKIAPSPSVLLRYQRRSFR